MTHGELEKNDALRSYVLAGNADVTLENENTGGRYTFRVCAPKKTTEAGGRVVDHTADVRFVKVLTGPDNSNDFTFIGTVFVKDDAYQPGRKSQLAADAPSSIAWRWFWGRLTSGKSLPEALHVYHAGRCGRCGRKLTVPESVRSGFGPECLHKVMGG